VIDEDGMHITISSHPMNYKHPDSKKLSLTEQTVLSRDAYGEILPQTTTRKQENIESSYCYLSPTRAEALQMVDAYKNNPETIERSPFEEDIIEY